MKPIRESRELDWSGEHMKLPPEKFEDKRYGQWAGNSKGYAYNPERCAEEVYDNWLSHQCRKKKGHGTDGLYCKQHSKYHPA